MNHLIRYALLMLLTLTVWSADRNGKVTQPPKLQLANDQIRRRPAKFAAETDGGRILIFAISRRQTVDAHSLSVRSMNDDLTRISFYRED